MCACKLHFFMFSELLIRVEHTLKNISRFYSINATGVYPTRDLWEGLKPVNTES